MKIQVKKSIKSIDYIKSMKILEQRVDDVFLGKRDELLQIIEHNSVYTAGTSSKKTDLLDSIKNNSSVESFSIFWLGMQPYNQVWEL